MTHEQLGQEIARLIAETGGPVYVIPSAAGLSIAVADEPPDDGITLLVEIRLENITDATVLGKRRAGKRIRTADMLLGKQPHRFPKKTGRAAGDNAE